MQTLPLENVYHILTYLSYIDILSFCKTNNKYYQILRDEYFWIKKAKFDFGDDSIIFIGDNINIKCSTLCLNPLEAYLELLSQYHYFNGCERFCCIDDCFSLAARDKNLNALLSSYCGLRALDSRVTHSIDSTMNKYIICRFENYIDGMIKFGLMLDDGNPHKLFSIGLTGDIDAINFAINKSAKSSNCYLPFLLEGIARNGNTYLFKKFFTLLREQFGSFVSLASCVCEAAINNNVDIIEYLFDKGHRSTLSCSCLAGAIIGNHFILADKMLKEGIHIDDDMFSDIIMRGNDLSVRYALKLGFIPNLEYISDYGSEEIECYNLSRTIAYSRKLDILKLLVNHNIDDIIQIILSHAIHSKNEYFIKYLLNKGGDINKITINNSNK